MTMGSPMAGHVDILEQEDAFWKPVLVSATVHVLVFAALIFSTKMQAKGGGFGVPNPGGGMGAVGVTAVRQIPLPGHSGPENPLANDTKSHVPQPPKPQTKAVKAPAPDAISLRGRQKPEKPVRAQESWQRFRSQPDRPNQLYSSSGQALSTNLYGGIPGTSGVVGVGPRSGFGTRFGAYAALLEQRVSQRWNTADVDRSVTSPVVVTFDLLRNGQIRGLRVLQSSNNRGLDYSAQRAITEAAPFPPLPQGFERDSAQVEFVFRLR